MTKYALGKGEVVSSILTGSTTNSHEIRVSEQRAEGYPASGYATKREHDISTSGKSVESVRQAFRDWAADKPEWVRNAVAVICSNLRRLERCPESADLRAVVASQIEHLSKET